MPENLINSVAGLAFLFLLLKYHIVLQVGWNHHFSNDHDATRVPAKEAWSFALAALLMAESLCLQKQISKMKI